MALINFSLPIIPSFVSTEPNKLVDVKLFDGSITQQLLFIPDIKVLLNFANGELGISDSIMKNMILKNLSKITSLGVAEQFLKSAGGKINVPVSEVFKDGKLSINPEQISFEKISGSLGGLKSLEKSMIQSIFETQKPYMEIFKLVIQNLVKIEDIIARVLAISGSSMDPKVNPRALGYKGQESEEFQKKMAELDGLIKADTGPKDIPKEEESTPEQVTENPSLKGGSWVTQSIVYSTGEFDPNVNYTYIYEYSNKVKEIKIDPNGTFSVPESTTDNHLPKYVIFGVFDSDFNLIQESLITTPPQEARLNGTISKNVNWINRSGKYFGSFGQIKESNGDFSYIRNQSGNIDKYNEEGHVIEVGPENNKEKKYIKKGLPKITGLTNLINYYNDYYLDETKRRAEKKGLSASQIDGVVAEIGNKLSTPDDTGSTGIQTTVEAALENGFLNLTNENNTTGIQPILSKFINVKFPFKPKKIRYNGEEIWVDPEAKYDMKIIKCDSSTDITFLDIESDNKKFKTTKIIRFVRDVLSLGLSDNSSFYYEISNSQNLPIPNFGTTAEISIDNTLGGNFGSVYSPPSQGTINIYSKFMPPQFRNGIIFTSPEDGNNYRLSKFLDTWKIEQIYWSINSSTREGDIISLSVYGGVKKEIGLDQIERVKIKFTDGVYYYFTTFDGQFIHRKVYESDIVSLRPQTNGERIQTTVNAETGAPTTVSSTIAPNSIRVDDSRYKFGRLISNTQVLNQNLAEKEKPLAKSKYGSPSNELKQSVEQIYRYQQTEDDTETYYIIEGILSSENSQKLASQNTQNDSSQSASRDYSFPDFIGVIPVFIEMLIDVFTKLIPNIKSLVDLISNPTKFVTDIIIAKIGDNNGTEPEKFGVFSKGFLDDLKKLSKIYTSNIDTKLSGLGNLVDTAKEVGKKSLEKLSQNMPQVDEKFGSIQDSLTDIKDGSESLINDFMSSAEEKIEYAELRRKLQDFVENSKLKNYVYITTKGKPKFFMDGTAKINLFGDAPMFKGLPSFTFGLEVNLSSLASGSFLPPVNLDVKEILKKSTSNITGISGISKNLGQSVKNALDVVDVRNLSSKVKDSISNIPLPFRPIFETSISLPNLTLSELSGLTEKFKQKLPKSLTNFNFEPTLEIPNEIFSKINDSNFFYQIADIQKKFKDPSKQNDSKYAAVTQSIQSKILEATKLQEIGELDKVVEILEEIQKFLPNNLSLKDSLSKLKSITKQPVQPIIKFMLNLVTLPLKVIFGIVKYIMDLFKSFLNPFELPFKIIDFVSFKWILDFFNPTSKNSILSMLGMKFDIQTLLTQYVPRLQAATALINTPVK